MKPFIIDPFNYDKRVVFDAGLEYVNGFLDKNHLDHPEAIITEALTPAKSKWHDYGWYKFGYRVIYVNLKKTRHPVKSPGFSWSYTGFKSDLTAPGILAHEVGHFIHDVANAVIDKKELISAIRKITKAEPPVSGYEPNAMEVFAESMRLFIMNPKLLEEGRPLRYSLIADVLKLSPPHDVPWRDVLVNAHPKIITAAENWSKKK